MKPGPGAAGAGIPPAPQLPGKRIRDPHGRAGPRGAASQPVAGTPARHERGAASGVRIRAMKTPPAGSPLSTPPRREFLKTTALAGAAASLGRLDGSAWALDGAAPGEDPAPAPSWVDRPMRWAQLTLVEDDPPKFDAEFWLDYFRRTRADAVCLSAGGCVAYYPTKVPFHHRSAWLGDRDVFGELVAGCRNWAWSSSPAPIRTPPTTTCRRRTRTGSPWTRRQAAPALGLAGDVGDLRARSLQLRVHDRGEAGDHVALPGGRHLHQPLGRLGHVLLRALPAELPAPPPVTTSPARPIHRTRRGTPTRSGSSNGCSSCGGCGTPRSARSIPTPASSPTPAAARPASST